MRPRSKKLYEIALRESADELTDYTVYKHLSTIGKDRRIRLVFSKLAAIEHRHYNFWKKYCPNVEARPNALTANFVLLIRRILGPSFLIKYLEGSEIGAIKRYEAMRPLIPKRDRKAFEAIVKDEEEHERAFADKVQQSYIRYISFIVLGLADALVEVAGIHAGSLGIYNSTFLTGLAGIIAGAAASLSMASASFAQAKQGFEGSASKAAAYTGGSYFIGAVILASPYFFTSNPITAIITSLALGMLMIALVSWYNSVMSESSLKKDFSELAGIMLGTTIVLFVMGFVIRHVFGISI
jgi:VIT1/CCC1 family predicted Fe2+/Mn2+ transporter